MAERVQNRLIEMGFIVQRYNAYTTNSIYLKLDYGICNSIRISDHKGKSYLHYRYNLSKQAKSVHIDKTGTYPRYFYPFTQYEIMLNDIARRRSGKIAKSGEDGYRTAMLEYKRNHENDKGFWQTAFLVNKELCQN